MRLDDNLGQPSRGLERERHGNRNLDDRERREPAGAIEALESQGRLGAAGFRQEEALFLERGLHLGPAHPPPGYVPSQGVAQHVLAHRLESPRSVRPEVRASAFPLLPAVVPDCPDVLKSAPPREPQGPKGIHGLATDLDVLVLEESAKRGDRLRGAFLHSSEVPCGREARLGNGVSRPSQEGGDVLLVGRCRWTLLERLRSPLSFLQPGKRFRVFRRPGREPYRVLILLPGGRDVPERLAYRSEVVAERRRARELLETALP